LSVFLKLRIFGGTVAVENFIKYDFGHFTPDVLLGCFSERLARIALLLMTKMKRREGAAEG